MNDAPPVRSETIARVDNEPSHGPNAPYKQLDSAKATYLEHRDGTREAYIEHAPMHGVTPEMLIWFFKHLDRYTRFNPWTKAFDGPEISVYKLWHLRDHVAIRPVAPGVNPEDAEHAIALGSVFSIEEVLLQKHPVAASSKVYDLYYDFPDGTRIGGGTSPNGTNGRETDKGNFGFWLLGPGGLRLGHLDHFFQVTDRDRNVMAFQTRFVAGRPNARLLNAVLRRRLAPRLMKDWILHNVEESGETENVLPALHRNQDKVLKRSEIARREVN